jgi:glycosyltransferase involved in cell wall biosynthesis
LADFPAVTVFIPTYNRSAMLRDILRRMMEQETGGMYSYDILIIDDASSDDTPAVVEELAARSPVPLRYVRESGVGYTGVLNRAVQEFDGDWLAIFDDDQMTHRRWLAQLVGVALAEGADMVGGPIRLALASDVLAAIGPVCRDLYGESPDVREPEKYRHDPPLPSGGNRLVRRRVFEQVGPFDENMLTGGCDRDFLLRAVDCGCTFGWHPQADGYHRIRPERITPVYIRWYSLQWGCSFAYVDWKRSGGLKTIIFCAARVVQALCIRLPGLALARLRNDSRNALDLEALLWRAVGYSRKTLQLAAPRLFPQKTFFSRVEFRRARENT